MYASCLSLYVIRIFIRGEKKPNTKHYIICIRDIYLQRITIVYYCLINLAVQEVFLSK